jgi:hypothetical protein
MVLRAPKCPDTLVANQPTKVLAILVTAKVFPKVFLPFDVFLELRSRSQVVPSVDDKEDGADDGAGGAHARGIGDIAGNGAVDAQQPREVVG